MISRKGAKKDRFIYRKKRNVSRKGAKAQRKTDSSIEKKGMSLAKAQRKTDSSMKTENELSKIIVDCCYKIHTALGPGLLESVYEEILLYEIRKRGLNCERQVEIPVVYDSLQMDMGFRADLVIENKVIAELKSIETLKDVHKKRS